MADVAPLDWDCLLDMRELSVSSMEMEWMLTGQTVSETIWILKLVMIAREATVTVLVYMVGSGKISEKIIIITDFDGS